MTIGKFCHHTSPGSTLDKALHDEERLIDLLHRTGILTDCRGNGGDTHRTTPELIDDGQQDAVVYLVQSILVNIQCRQGDLRNLRIDTTSALHLCEVTDTPQQRIGNTGRTAGAA